MTQRFDELIEQGYCRVPDILPTALRKRLAAATHRNETDERRTVITLWFQPDMTALPERMQAQMAAKVQPIPPQWPEAAKALMSPLLTRYQGSALPYERTLYRKA